MNKLVAIYHQQGRWEDASEMFARSFSAGGRLSVEDIKSDPLMGDLRADPRFGRLLDETLPEENEPVPADPPRR
jgi:hypothetical protein